MPRIHSDHLNSYVIFSVSVLIFCWLVMFFFIQAHGMVEFPHYWPFLSCKASVEIFPFAIGMLDEGFAKGAG